MTPQWWVLIPDLDKSRSQRIFDEAMKYGRIGLSFAHHMGDLRDYGDNEEKIGRRFNQDVGGGNTPRQISSFVSMFINIRDGIGIGDMILYPSTAVNKKLNIGQVTSNYNFNPDMELAHNRDVSWIAHYPRTDFDADILKKYPKALAVSPMKGDNPFLRVLLAKLAKDQR